MKKCIALGLAALLLCGCQARTSGVQETVFAMDTVMDLQLWGEDAQAGIDAIGQLLLELEDTWSATDENSLLSQLNRDQGSPDAQQQALLDRAEELCKQTEGAFDPKLQDLVALWGFYSKNYRVPTQEEIQIAAQQAHWDLGGILKGYAASRAVEILEELDVDRAILNLGGNVQTFGSKPDGSAWNIGIQAPQGGVLGYVQVEGTMTIATSGDYQRYFEEDGIRYHHILDPGTGAPASSGLSSVTAICADGARADALSTALFVMGLEEAKQFWRENRDFEAVFVESDGQVYATEGVVMTGLVYAAIAYEEP